jgi:putative salt-induced outer membrane protein YdiY
VNNNLLRYLSVCTLTASVFAPAALAITNIENERPRLPDEGLSGSVKLGLGGKTGDEEQESYEGAAKVTYRQDNNIFLGLLAREYGSDHDEKDTDNTFIHGRWTHLLNERWGVEGFGQWEKNEFKNLNSRVLAGGGGRYTIAQRRDVYSFVIGAGAFREYEKLDLVSYEEHNRLWRMNSYYSYSHQLNPQVALINTTYYQPATNNWDDYRVLFDAGIDVKLSDKLVLRLNYRLTYDSEPAQNLDLPEPIDNHKTNSEYKTAIAFNF